AADARPEGDKPSGLLFFGRGMQPAAVLIGTGGGVVVGVTSTGGGALLTPPLVFLLRVPPSVAAGSGVLIARRTKRLGSGGYAPRRLVDWPTVGHLFVGSLPGAILGVALLDHIAPDVREHVLQRALGFVLVLAGVASLVRLQFRPRTPPPAAPSAPVTAALGFV